MSDILRPQQEERNWLAAQARIEAVEERAAIHQRITSRARQEERLQERLMSQLPTVDSPEASLADTLAFMFQAVTLMPPRLRAGSRKRGN